MRPQSRTTAPSVDNASMTAWVAAFLSEKPLTSVRKVLEWQEWAIAKLASGWTPDAVKKRIRDAWVEWVQAGNVDLEPMPPELLKALNDVYKLADEGGTPAQCAVVYRSLARQYPKRLWLADAAAKWEEMDERWTLTPESNG